MKTLTVSTRRQSTKIPTSNIILCFLAAAPASSVVVSRFFAHAFQIGGGRHSFLARHSYRNTLSRLYSTSSTLMQPSSESYDEEDLRRWEQMYEGSSGRSKDGGTTGMAHTGAGEIRVITCDLDNTLWNTTATIQAANDALALHMNEKLPGNSLRVETVMGKLFGADKARYCPIEKEDAKSPVLLTQLRKDAIRHVLEQHSGEKDDDAEDTSAFVDAAFEVWTTARHGAIPQHLATNVESCLKEMRSLRTRNDIPVVVGAVTDGNSDPLSIPELGEYFDFCINAEMVGISKPDKRVYLRAVAQAIQHPSLRDLLPSKDDDGELTDEALEDLVGPWWVHIGDDFQKDIVAPKSLNMRTVWARELILDKIVKTETSNKVAAGSSKSGRTVEDLVKQVSEMKVVEMQLGAEDYLAESLQREFADAITDEFHTIATILQQWHGHAANDYLDDKSMNKPVDSMATDDSSSFPVVEVTGPDKVPPTENIQKDTKFCIYCGTKLPILAKFCSSCGEQQ